MATKKYVTLENLTHLKEKLDETYVSKELKTGSEDQYKVLSDNNLTDELVGKINGASTFDGTYDALTGKPAIDGTELSSDSTAESLGLAKADQLPKPATQEAAGLVKPGTGLTVTDDGTLNAAEVDLSTYALKTELPSKATTETEGIVKPDGTSITVDDGTISATPPDLSNYVQTEAIQDMLTKTEAAADYATKTELDGYVEDSEITDMLTQTQAAEEYAKKEEAATKAELADYAKSSQVATDIQEAKTELEGTINSKISSTYKPKGTVEFASLPETPTEAELGNVYNVSNAFTTNEKFVEGPSKYYTAGSNVVVVDAGGGDYKFDVLAGVVDLSAYAKTEDFVDVTNEEIDALFGEVAAKQSSVIATTKTEGSYLGNDWTAYGTFQVDGLNITGESNKVTAQGWNGEGQDQQGYFLGIHLENCKTLKTANKPNGVANDGTSDWLLLLGTDSITMKYFDAEDNAGKTDRYTINVTAKA